MILDLIKYKKNRNRIKDIDDRKFLFYLDKTFFKYANNFLYYFSLIIINKLLSQFYRRLLLGK